ncbi:MAG: hypothetical protein CFE34_15655 [Rhodobacteraceae bacterium PARR1]|nr:MAG: hypothetical protein CFE34_15655 [Rhodobacteraceae bacterium PARR1]
MRESQPMDTDHPVVSLYDSLIAVGWEKYNFGYAGPYPPYLTVGMMITLDGPKLAFTSFIRDRILLRTKVSVEHHLRNFQFIRILPEACEDVFGRAWAHETGFPVNTWLRLRPVTFQKHMFTQFFVWRSDPGEIIQVPIDLFSICKKIELKGPVSS